MNITRNNYEEFFMLYADNELPAAERKEVEAFIAANPDLQQELALFQQFKLSPDAAVIFTGKQALMKPENGRETITISNHESFFVLYADDELTNNEKAEVEDFVYHHPQLQAAFELIQQVRLSPDTSIVFDNKESLYRKEDDDKVVPFRWWKLAVAAMVVLIAGIYWLYQANKTNPPAELVKNTQPVTIPQQPPLYKIEKGASIDTNNNEQPVRELAATDTKKENQPVRSGQPAHLVAVSRKKQINRNNGKTTDEPVAVIEEAFAQDTRNRLTATTITSIKNTAGKKAEINTNIAAAASKSVKNNQLTYLNPGEDNEAYAEQVAATNNDKLEVLNTSVDTKNSLRGFFRKASRLIAKKTSLGDEDSKRKSILIGGFEIAVR